MRRWALVGAGAVFVAAFAVGLAVVRPLTIAPIGPDAAAPVIEFDRLLAGQRLEGYLSQTSKPFFTLVYGLAHALTDDWRSVSLLAIGSFALFAALASLLAHRLAGVAAAAFTGIAIALWPTLLRDVAFAYGVSWALLACAIAGLAVTDERPRFGTAGIALALGALMRPEVLAVTAVALGWVVVGHVIARLGPIARLGRIDPPPTRAWLLSIGLVAVLVMSAHDWALTGDALFWVNTAQANSEGSNQVRSLRRMITFVAGHALETAALLPLAALGVAERIVRRRWRDAVVVSIVPMAVAVFYIASGARGTVVSQRYLLPVEVGLVFAAGIGLGAIHLPRLRRALPRRLRAGPAGAGLAVLLGAVVALAVSPSWLTSRDVRASVETHRQKVLTAVRTIPIVANELGPTPPRWRGVPVPADATTLVLFPAATRAQAVVDLDLPLWAVTKSSASRVAPERGLPVPGTLIVHDRADDPPRPIWRALEVAETTVLGRLRIVPILADEETGTWILRVEDSAR